MMPEVFESSVLPLKNRLFRFANSILEDHDLSKDVVQETLVKAWEKRNELERIKNMEAWCMTVARNYALDMLRSKHHRNLALKEGQDREDGSLSPYLRVEMGDTISVIKGIKSALPLKQKEVFQLRDVEGLSYQEISEITGYNINDVKVCIFRARKTIKTSLQKLQTHGLEKNRSAS